MEQSVVDTNNPQMMEFIQKADNVFSEINGQSTGIVTERSNAVEATLADMAGLDGTQFDNSNPQLRSNADNPATMDIHYPDISEQHAQAIVDFINNKAEYGAATSVLTDVGKVVQVDIDTMTRSILPEMDQHLEKVSANKEGIAMINSFQHDSGVDEATFVKTGVPEAQELSAPASEQTVNRGLSLK